MKSMYVKKMNTMKIMMKRMRMMSMMMKRVRNLNLTQMNGTVIMLLIINIGKF